VKWDAVHLSEELVGGEHAAQVECAVAKRSHFLVAVLCEFRLHQVVFAVRLASLHSAGGFLTDPAAQQNSQSSVLVTPCPRLLKTA